MTTKRVFLISTITWLCLEMIGSGVNYLSREDESTALEKCGGALMEAATKRALRRFRPVEEE